MEENVAQLTAGSRRMSSEREQIPQLGRTYILGSRQIMLTFILWCFLLFFCWPLAVLAVVLYPFVWLLLLPFRLAGFAVEGALDLVKSIIMLPARVLRGRRSA
jgi:hypothetical protein